MQKEKIEKTAISVLLDSYDDIFSDFDPREYSERGLSDDFLKEAKKFSLSSNEDSITLSLLIPSELRVTDDERIIIERLRRHFDKHHAQYRRESRAKMVSGILFFLTGVALMAIAAYLSLHSGKDFSLHFLRVTVEPGGWFLIWNGFDRIIFAPARKRADADFYRLMANGDIQFVGYHAGDYAD